MCACVRACLSVCLCICSLFRMCVHIFRDDVHFLLRVLIGWMFIFLFFCIASRHSTKTLSPRAPAVFAASCDTTVCEMKLHCMRFNVFG